MYGLCVSVRISVNCVHKCLPASVANSGILSLAISGFFEAVGIFISETQSRDFWGILRARSSKFRNRFFCEID